MFSLAKGTQLYFSCCRDGNYRQNKWSKRKTDKTRRCSSSRKLDNYCVSRIYATLTESGTVSVTHIATHTNHTLGVDESKHLPLPNSVKESIRIKLQDGIPIERIMDGMIMVFWHAIISQTCS